MLQDMCQLFGWNNSETIDSSIYMVTTTTGNLQILQVDHKVKLSIM